MAPARYGRPDPKQPIQSGLTRDSRMNSNSADNAPIQNSIWNMTKCRKKSASVKVRSKTAIDCDRK